MKHTEKDVVANPNVSIGPGDFSLLEDFLQASFVSVSFIGLGPIMRAVDQQKPFFDFARDHKAEVHVRGLSDGM